MNKKLDKLYNALQRTPMERINDGLRELYNQLLYASWLLVILGAQAGTSIMAVIALPKLGTTITIVFWSLITICLLDWYATICAYLNKEDEER